MCNYFWLDSTKDWNLYCANEEEAIFVVTKIKADYLSPAHFDDILTVDTRIKVVSPVRA